MIYHRLSIRERLRFWWWRHWPRPATPEPELEPAGTLSSDGTPCRGWPLADNELIDQELELERQGEPWPDPAGAPERGGEP